MSQDMGLNRETIISSLTSRMMVLSAVMLLAGVLVVAIGVGVFGTGVYEALLGWAVCTIAAVLAHIGGEYPRGDFNFAARLAIQMVVRTVPPFAVALWGTNFAEPPLEKSLVFYMILFYLIGLVTDVQLSLARLKTE